MFCFQFGQVKWILLLASYIWMLCLNDSWYLNTFWYLCLYVLFSIRTGEVDTAIWYFDNHMLIWIQFDNLLNLIPSLQHLNPLLHYNLTPPSTPSPHLSIRQAKTSGKLFLFRVKYILSHITYLLSTLHHPLNTLLTPFEHPLNTLSRHPLNTLWTPS